MKGASGLCCSDFLKHLWIEVVRVFDCCPLLDCDGLTEFRRHDSNGVPCRISSFDLGNFVGKVGVVLLIVQIAIFAFWEGLVATLSLCALFCGLTLCALVPGLVWVGLVS